MSDPRNPHRLVQGVSIACIAAAVAPASELLAALTPDERFAVHREIEAQLEPLPRRGRAMTHSPQGQEEHHEGEHHG
jgi:hypothetical protein